MPVSYALSAWFFLRALGLVYLVAFVSLAWQARGLWGSRGVLPVSGYLQAVESAVGGGAERFLQLPSLFWWQSSDAAIVGWSALGIVAALAVVFGVAQGWMLLLCYLIYLSYVSAGQEFMSFQWDALLLEVGFLALFAASWSFSFTLRQTVEPHWTVRWLFYLVLFKLMFLSGVVKLTSGDPAWRDMTALSYHYWTQPLPNPLSPFMHALPMWMHRMSTVQTFLVELIFPFLIFPPLTRLWAAAGFFLLSVFIFTTGNYTFFNLLTLALCFWLVPDAVWQRLVDFLGLPLTSVPPPPSWPHPAHLVIYAALGLFSLFWSTRWFLPDAVDDIVRPVIRPLQAFHISNSYGLFATMTKTRPEIVIEGSRDGSAWKEYVFRFKPGDLSRPPPIIEPLQPRLDWQMWFAALGTFRQNPFVQNLMVRLFEGSPDVAGFFSTNPFPDEPPKFLRARLYAYEFTTPNEIFSDGLWWKRTLMGEYSPTFQH
jgi:hypothetical protein